MEQKYEWNGEEVAELMRGRSYISSQELEIIHSRRISFEEKWDKIAAIRQARSEKMARRKTKAGSKGTKKIETLTPFPQTFEQRISEADLLHARAFGITLN